MDDETIFRDIRKHTSQRVQAILRDAVGILDSREDSLKLLVALTSEMFITTCAAMLTTLPKVNRRTGFVRTTMLAILAARMNHESFESHMNATILEVDRLEKHGQES